MNLTSPLLASLSLRQLLILKLHGINPLHGRVGQLGEFPGEQNPGRLSPWLQSLSVREIPLNRVRQSTQVWYVSAIALKLSKSWGQSAIDIAKGFAETLVQSIEAVNVTTEPQSIDRIWQNFTIQVSSPGWIYLKLTESGLAEWLQRLIDLDIESIAPPSGHRGGNPFHNIRNYTDPSKSTRNCTDVDLPTPIFIRSNQVPRNSTDLFYLQQSYARCCSLLHTTTPMMFDLESGRGETRSPLARMVTPLPWLVNHQLRCTHPTELELISQFVTICDRYACHLDPPDQSQVLTLAQDLAHAFQNFDAACRLWGEIQTIDRPRVQVRLGLILGTQKMLRFLLEQELGVIAPPEL